MDTVWILVAEAARARILSCQGRACRDLKELEALVHSESQARGRDLTSDRPGRSWANTAGDGRHAMAEPTDPAAYELVRFAREVVKRLDAAHHQGSFKHLVVVAAPAFLGALRDAMDRPLAQTVRAEVAKNVVKIEDPEKLRAYLPDFIY